METQQRGLSGLNGRAAAMLMLLVATSDAQSDITNEATASGTYRGGTVISSPVSTSVGVMPVSPSMTVTQSASVLDNDGTPGISPGDVIEFILSVQNTGDTAISELSMVSVTDQAGKLQPVLEAVAAGAGSATPNRLELGAKQDFVMRHSVSRANIEHGGNIGNFVTVRGVAGSEVVARRSSISADLPPLQGIEPDDLSLAVVPGTYKTEPGDTIELALVILNRGVFELGGELALRLTDGFKIVSGSARIEDAVTGEIIGQDDPSFDIVRVPARGGVVFRLRVEVSATLTPGAYPIAAELTDPASGIALLDRSETTVSIGTDLQSNCAGVTILVFHDQNRDGVAGRAEAGLSGVRIRRRDGPPVTTGRDGRYVSPCIVESRLGGVDFDADVDIGTLPEGYFVTSPNPQRVRIERRQTADINFGAASAQIVRVDLNAAAFRAETAAPDEQLINDVTFLLAILDRQPSVLRLTYRAYREPPDLSERRLRALRRLILDRWSASGGDYDLQIQTRVVSEEG